MSSSVFEREICEIDKNTCFFYSILLFSLAGPVETLKSTKIRSFVDFKDPHFKNGTAHTKISIFKHLRVPSTRWPLLDDGRDNTPKRHRCHAVVAFVWGSGHVVFVLGLLHQNGSFTEARARCAKVRRGFSKVCAQRVHTTCVPRADHV